MAELSNAIISIRPRFADAILAGEKTVELRRRIPALELGTRLWIYSTMPVGAVVGTTTVCSILREHPDDLWAKVRDFAGLQRPEFDEYFEGAPQAVAIFLTEPQRVQSVSIEQLREIRTGFHPPQVLMRVSQDEARALQFSSAKAGQH